MAAKKAKGDPVLKVRVPFDLKEKVNDYRHTQKMDSITDAVVALLNLGLARAKPKDGTEEAVDTPS